MPITERLTEGVRAALARAGLPEPEACLWEVPRQAEHGDYATNVALTLARAARRTPRQVAELIVKHFPEFVSANPTGPLVIVSARAAAVGDSLARLLRAQGAQVTTEFYVNDAGTQFEALARSLEARVLQELGQPASLPANGYPGDYLVDLAREYLAEQRGASVPEREAADALLVRGGERERLEHFGRYAVSRILEQQRRVLRDYGVEFDVWTSEQRDVRDLHLPEKVLEELAARKLTYEHEGALWFRSSALGEEVGDDKDRVLRRSNGEVTYFAVDVAYHHYVKFRSADRVINLFGPDHHGYVPRMKAAMQALGHPPDAFEVLIVQLVTLLRDGQPVRMSKRRGEFVLMEELLEEVGRDAARFTFLTRRHDSPLEFDLAVATRQSAENPVYYVQYAHARIASIYKQAAEQGIGVPPLGEVDLSPLREGEEIAIIKRLVQYPEIVRGAARALEPHRVAYWLRELAGVFHPYYKNHRVILDDRRLMFARLALCAGVGRVVRNGLALLGVNAPESM
ncbi:MAG: arginine--tRNA ligase [Candidatus Rokubacteria bacterium 13_2_20CM_2_70_11]|nr:MAG: arginine--tRNA ligase [Candidatus Rokubacteria bacterium 13_2_20CM_2_70_11]